MCPQNWFFGFQSAGMRFLREQFQSPIRYPISHKKGHIHFCRPTPHFLKNGLALQKLFFTVILESIVFFFEKIVIQKYSKPRFLQKSLYYFCRQTPVYPQNGLVLPQKIFHNFFNIN